LAHLHLGEEEKKDRLFSEYLINYCFLLLYTFVCFTTLFLISKTAEWKSTVKTLRRQSVDEQTLIYRYCAPMVGRRVLFNIGTLSEQADRHVHTLFQHIKIVYVTILY